MRTSIRRGLAVAAGLAVPLSVTAQSGPWTPTPNNASGFSPAQGITPAANSNMAALDANAAVGVHNLELVFAKVDIRIPSKGLDLEFVRHYRSQISYDGPLGYNWSHGYDRKLYLDNGVLMHQSVLDITSYGASGALRDCQTPGVYRKVREVGNEWEVRYPNGRIERYHAIDSSATSGRLKYVQDTAGNRLTCLYDRAGRLAQVRDALNRTLTLGYSTSHRIETVTDFSGRVTSYSYDGDNLEFVTYPTINGTPTGPDGAAYDFPSGTKIKYSYSTPNPSQPTLEHNLETITYPNEVAANGSAAITISYDANDLVQTAAVGGTNASGVPSGGTFVFTRGAGQGSEVAKTTVTDRRGINREYGFNAAGQSLRVELFTTGIRASDPTSFITSYTFTSHGEIKKITRQDGQQTILTWNHGAGDHFQRGNQLTKVEKPAAGAPGGAHDFVSTSRHEPIFNQEFRSEENGWTENLDYQEGNPATSPIQQLITDWGINVGTFPVFLNQDLNGDNVTSHVAGQVIVEASPQVTAGVATPYQIIRYHTYDSSGRRISSSNGEGAVTVHNYDDSQGGQMTWRIVDIDPSADEAPATAAYGLWNKPGYVAHVSARTDFEYDAVGNVIRETDPRGVRTAWLHDAQGRTIRETRGESIDASRLDSTLAALNAAGYSHLVTPQFVTWNRFDANGNLVQSDTQLSGTGVPGNQWATTEFEYDIENRLVTRIDELTPTASAATRYRFGPNGKPTSTTDADGGVTQTAYDERGMVFSTSFIASDPSKNAVTTFDYDVNGNLTVTSGPEDHDNDGTLDQTVREYDGRSRLLQVTHPDGSYDEMTYTASDGSEGIKRYGSPGFGSAVTLLAEKTGLRDEIGRVFQTKVRHFVPSIAGMNLPYAPTDSWRLQTMTLDRDSQTIVNEDEDQRATSYVYDGLGRVVRSTDHLGNVQLEALDAIGNNIATTLIEAVNGGGTPPRKTEVRVFDGVGRLVRFTDAMGRSTHYAYDSRGGKVAQTDAEGPMVADPLGLLLTGTNAPGNARRWVLNAVGAVQSSFADHFVGGIGVGTDIWAANFSPAAAPTGTVATASTHYEYDGAGRVLMVASGEGRKNRATYDDFGRVESKTHPDNTSEAFTYWRDGLLQSHRYFDADGSELRRINYDYGPRGLIASKTVILPAGSPIEGTTSQTFEHNGNGVVWRSVDDNGSGTDAVVERVIDSFGATIMETLNGRDVARKFDPAGRRTDLWFPGGRHVVFGWNNLHHLETVHESGGAQIASMTYTGAGRLLRTDFGSTAAAQSLEAATAGNPDGYDAVGNPLRIDQVANTTSSITYTRNRRGQASTIDRTIGAAPPLTDQGTHDSLGRLAILTAGAPPAGTPQKRTAWRFDDDNAWTMMSEKLGVSPWVGYPFTPDGVAAYSTIAGKSLDHDEFGNRIRDEWFDYFYDAFDRLVRIEGRFNGVDVVTFAYDCNGRRIEKVDQIFGIVTRYSYEGDQVVGEYDASDSMVAEYVSGEYLDQAIQMRRGGQDYYYLTDALGSVTGLVNASGSVVERYRYDAYGAPTFLDANGNEQAILASNVGNPYLFNAREYDMETAAYKHTLNLGGYFSNSSVTGLYNYRNRYMDPAEGRFVTRDPLSQAGNAPIDPTLLVERTLNRGFATSPYDYVDSKPDHLVDPLGLQDTGCIGSQSLRQSGPGRFHRAVDAARRGRIAQAGTAGVQGPGKFVTNVGKGVRAAPALASAFAANEALHGNWKAAGDSGLSCILLATANPYGVAACAVWSIKDIPTGIGPMAPPPGPDGAPKTRENSYKWNRGTGEFPYHTSCRVDENGNDVINGVDCSPETPPPAPPTPPSQLASYSQDRYGKWRWARDVNNMEACSANLPASIGKGRKKAWKYYCNYTPPPSPPVIRVHVAPTPPTKEPGPKGPTTRGPSGPSAPGGAGGGDTGGGGPSTPIGKSYKIVEYTVAGLKRKTLKFDHAACGKEGEESESTGTPGNETPKKRNAMWNPQKSKRYPTGISIERRSNGVVASLTGAVANRGRFALHRVGEDGSLRAVQHGDLPTTAVVTVLDRTAPAGASYVLEVLTEDQERCLYGPIEPQRAASPVVAEALESFDEERGGFSLLGFLACALLSGLGFVMRRN